MGTVTGLTAARMLLIEAASIVSARIEDDELILRTYGEVDINVGNVRGSQGATGEDGPEGPEGPPGTSEFIVPSVKASWNVAANGNDTLTLGVIPDGDSLQVFKNGLLLQPEVDYTRLDNLIAFAISLTIDDVISDQYLTTAITDNSILSTTESEPVYDEVVASVSGAAYDYIAASYIGADKSCGQYFVPNADKTIGAIGITFVESPAAGTYKVGISSNSANGAPVFVCSGTIVNPVIGFNKFYMDDPDLITSGTPYLIYVDKADSLGITTFSSATVVGGGVGQLKYGPYDNLSNNGLDNHFFPSILYGPS